MKAIDLCCGAGGFSEGFRQAGFEIMLGIDTDFLAIHSFQLNFDCEVWQRDIKEIWSLPECDVLIGSPPCPHFSEMNIGFDEKPDTSIIEAFLRIVELVKPRYWIMENVPKVVEFIPKNGTENKIITLQANWFGLYHKRKRAFIGDFPTVDKITDNRIIYPTPIAQDYHYHKSNNNPKIKCITDYFGFTPDIDVFKRIMGFPDNFIFVGKKKDQIRQLGNAVCPPVAKVIAEAIIRDME